MAFLKETERSLRLYFIVVGVIGTLAAFMALSDATKTSRMPIPTIVTIAIWFPALARLVLGPAFVVAGVNLKRALENGASGTRQLVKIAAAVLIVEVVLVAAAANSIPGAKSADLTGEAIGRAVIPLLILWYIHASLKRLADESQRRIVDTVGRKFE